MAFGFLVEKFDLFLQVAAPSLAGRQLSIPGQRFANLVGRERVVAGTDCGLGMRVHPQIARAKLKALADGAALATKALWAS